MLTKRAPFSFHWGFANIPDPLTLNLHTCAPIAITVGRDTAMNDPDVLPRPPYTMIAYPENGTPIASFLGDGTSTMQWTPRFAAGTKILLSVVDSLGNSGGVSRRSYILGSGITSCLPSGTNSDLRFSIDTSGRSLQTCDALPIRIEGGSKPYTVTISSTDADSSFNTTLSSENDLFQWINRARPGQELIASVSDSTGRYAVSSQLFNTAGDEDTACPGRQDSQSSVGGTSFPNTRTATSTGPSSSASNSDQVPPASKNLAGAIIGTIVAILVIFGIIAYIFFRRRNQRHFGAKSSGSGGFGLMEYKRGSNMAGNDSFIPLHDQDASPNVSKTPLYGSEPYSPNTAGAFGGPGSRKSGLDYYTSPPASFGNVPPSSVAGSTASTGVGLGVGMQASNQHNHQIHHQQGWKGTQTAPTVYPPASSYTVNPFGDHMYPYNPSVGGGPQSTVESATHAHAPSHSIGSTLAYGAPQPAPATNISGSGGQSRTLTAAERKAQEAAQESRIAYDDDDDDPIPYMQQNRLVLGVTNPDRQSVATTNTSNSDVYGGISNTPIPQVIQHEDAGGVIELPPAYREFSKTPAPGT